MIYFIKETQYHFDKSYYFSALKVKYEDVPGGLGPRVPGFRTKGVQDLRSA
jgi:hypothetical protein